MNNVEGPDAIAGTLHPAGAPPLVRSGGDELRDVLTNRICCNAIFGEPFARRL